MTGINKIELGKKSVRYSFGSYPGLVWILIYIFGIYQVLRGPYPGSAERNKVVNLLYPALRGFYPLNGTRNLISANTKVSFYSGPTRSLNRISQSSRLYPIPIWQVEPKIKFIIKYRCGFLSGFYSVYIRCTYKFRGIDISWCN